MKKYNGAKALGGMWDIYHDEKPCFSWMTKANYKNKW